MGDIGHLTNRTVEVWRVVRTEDGAGGWITSPLYSHDLEVRISQAPNARERSFARTQVGDMQGAAEFSHVIYADGYADLKRGDELRDEEFDEWYRVVAVQRPSEAQTYVRADSQLVQTEPTEPEGS